MDYDFLNKDKAPQDLIEEFENAIRMDMQELIENERTKKWKSFIDNKKAQWNSQIQNLQLTLPCAKNGTPYQVTIPYKHGDIVINHIDILYNDENEDFTVQFDNDCYSILGDPHRENLAPVNINVQFDFSLYKWPDITIATKTLPLILNPDPKRLWRDLPVPEDTEYPKVNEECDFINPNDLVNQKEILDNNNPTPQKIAEDKDVTKKQNETEPALSHAKCLIAASKRGRSHAHEAKPRDDHYAINFSENGWYLAIVADGAGSAPFSREGSRIACETASRICLNQLMLCDKLEEQILAFWTVSNQKDGDTLLLNKARKEVGDGIYNILGKAAFQTFSEIKSVANAKNRKAKDYATTLLLSIAKKFNSFWFVASFWVGDGAIGIYNNTNNTVKLMCNPDEGEYSGQTRFVTMPEIFASAKSIYERLRFCIVKDFSSLLLMTDGVSDAFFETDKNLEDPEKWQNLMNNINLALKGEDNTLPTPEIQAKRLLDFLNFWSPGNHDDRTLVLLQ